jgi:drug/metabolite transporter (DMT)-like permease
MSDSASFSDRLRDNWGRLAYGGVFAGLATGIFLFRLGQTQAGSFALAATCGLLITLPIVNVVLVLAEEIRRRDWIFVGLAFAVLALIAWTLISRLR